MQSEWLNWAKTFQSLHHENPYMLCILFCIGHLLDTIPKFKAQSFLQNLQWHVSTFCTAVIVVMLIILRILACDVRC